MAKIYEFELKGIKKTENDGLVGSLYYQNKKVAIYTDNNNGEIPTLQFESKLKEDEIEIIINEIRSYYTAYPKELISNETKYLLIDFIEELYRLKELETIFKKTNKKEENVLIELRFSKREKYISDYQSEDICLTTTLWNDEFKTNLLEKYKPAEYTIYSTLDDFNILK